MLRIPGCGGRLNFDEDVGHENHLRLHPLSTTVTTLTIIHAITIITIVGIIGSNLRSNHIITIAMMIFRDSIIPITYILSAEPRQ